MQPRAGDRPHGLLNPTWLPRSTRKSNLNEFMYFVNFKMRGPWGLAEPEVSQNSPCLESVGKAQQSSEKYTYL